MIYFDNAATTRMSDSVLREMLPYLRDEFGNPDSVHRAAENPRRAVKEAESRIETMIHANGLGKVVFTSGGTESNNMVFRLLTARQPAALNIITSNTEHKSVLEPALACHRSPIRFLKPGKKGYISLSDLHENEIPEFTLISIMDMNNETGMMNDVYNIGDKLKAFRNNQVFYHVDCVQSAGEVCIDAVAMNADMITMSSHKIHGPKGVGCIWISNRLLERVEPDTLPMIIGGGQQGGFRSGTVNVPGIVGFGKAAQIADCGTGTGEAAEVVKTVSNHFVKVLKEICKQHGIRMKVNFENSAQHDPKVLSITFPGADSETTVMVASQKGLCISNGAACNSVSSEPSYVLLNSGFTPEAARNTVRVSFSRYNEYTEAERGAEILADAVSEVLSLTDMGL